MKKIRKARSDDAKGIHEAQIKSIREISSNVWVIDSGGTLEGYGYLEFKTSDSPRIAYINGPFLTAQAASLGFAKQIMQTLMQAFGIEITRYTMRLALDRSNGV